MRTNTYTRSKYDDSFQRRAQFEDTMSLVRLLLFTNEEEPDPRNLDHVLYLLLRACSIEWKTDGAYSVCTKVCIEVLNTVL